MQNKQKTVFVSFDIKFIRLDQKHVGLDIPTLFRSRLINLISKTLTMYCLYPYIFVAEINECDTTTCLNGGTCKDEVNSFFCQCPTGFTGTLCEQSKYTVRYLTESSETIFFRFSFYLLSFLVT